MRQPMIDLAGRRANGSHPGLLLQRYLVPPADPGERSTLFNAVIHTAQSQALREIYGAAFARWTRSFPDDGLHASLELRTASRLVVGLGSENVLEAGLRLHHTYGVPIIPGSALKGLAAHYCHDVWGQRHSESPAEENRKFRRGETYHRVLFGTTDDGGVITFHDAWILPASLGEKALRLDVMTPHHPQWQINEAPPTDFDSPIPVSFLSVAGTFAVRVSWCGPAETPLDQARSWAALAMQVLQEALAEWGVGGKTSSGYGRMVVPEALPPTELAPSRHRAQTATRAAQPTLPAPGTTVEAQLLAERTKKRGWKARHQPSDLSGPIQNSGDVPADKKAGDTLNLIVASANQREIAFRYPTPADEQRAQQARSKPKSGAPPRRGGR